MEALRLKFFEVLPRIRKCKEIIQKERELSQIVERLSEANDHFLSYEEKMKSPENMADEQIKDLRKTIHLIANLATAAELKRENINLLVKDVMQES